MGNVGEWTRGDQPSAVNHTSFLGVTQRTIQGKEVLWKEGPLSGSTRIPD